MCKRIGLTGNMGCGKSTVARIFARFPSVTTVITDDLSKEIAFAPEHEIAIRSILALTPDCPLNISSITNVIWRDPKRRMSLERYVGHFVLAHVDAMCASPHAPQFVVVESALIYERNIAAYFDTVIVVTCSKEKQCQQLRDRGNFTRTEIRQRLALLLPQDVLVRRADHVIRNDGSLIDLESEVGKVYEQLIRKDRSI